MGGYDRRIAEALEHIAESQIALAKAWGSDDSDRIQQNLGAMADQLQAINFRLDKLPTLQKPEVTKEELFTSMIRAGMTPNEADKWVKNLSEREAKKPAKDELRRQASHILRLAGVDDETAVVWVDRLMKKVDEETKS